MKISKPLYSLTLCPIFDEAAKLCKASKDAYNWEGWLISKDLLNEWIAIGVIFEVLDFSQRPTKVFTTFLESLVIKLKKLTVNNVL